MFAVNLIYQVAVKQEVASGADKVLLSQFFFDDTESFQHNFLPFDQHDVGIVAAGTYVNHFVLACIEGAVQGAKRKLA